MIANLLGNGIWEFHVDLFPFRGGRVADSFLILTLLKYV